jgi:cell division protein FtsZ
MADQVLYMGVRGVTDLMMVHGLVNLDFADIRTVMAEMGKAMMGTGEAEGENRAIVAAEAAINNPLLEDTSMSGARGLLINITGGEDLTLFEVDQAANRIRAEVDEEANVIFGSAVDESLTGRIRVSVVATGIDSHKTSEQTRPKLVAVGGGAAPAPQPIHVRPVVPAAASGPVTAQPMPQLRQVSSQQEAMETVGMMTEAQIAATAAAARPVQSRHPQMQPLPSSQSGARPGLFANQQRAVPVATPATQPLPDLEPVRQSLFNTVTGAFRRRGAPQYPPAGQPQSLRREPPLEHVQPDGPRVAVRQASAADEAGIEIPAFLRRQSS